MIQALPCYQHPSFWKIAALALLGMWITFFDWEIAQLDYFWHMTEYDIKQKRGNHRDKSKKAMNISKYP